MEWDTKAKIRVGVIVLVVILFSVAGIVRLLNSSDSISSGERAVTHPAQATEVVIGDAKAEQVPTPEPPPQPDSAVQDNASAQLKRFALDFASRFGTFSTDAPNENIKQLLPRMTGELETWARARLKEAPVFVQAQRVTTRALSSKIMSETAVGAQVTVQAQRVYRDAQGERVTYETAQLLVRKSNLGYLVERLQWKVRE